METIRLTRTSQNFYKLIKPLQVFDQIISGADYSLDIKDKYGFSEEDSVLVCSLMEYGDETIPKYIRDTFKVFTQNKKTIIINLDHLLGYDVPSHLRTLIFRKSAAGHGGDYDKDKTEYDLVSDENKNMIKEELVKLFKNTENIQIYATDYFGYESYLFSFDGLLKMVQETKRKNLIWSIYGIWKDRFSESEEEGRRSWVYYTFQKRNWQQKYTNIYINYQITKDGWNGFKQDLLSLSLK